MVFDPDAGTLTAPAGGVGVEAILLLTELARASFVAAEQVAEGGCVSGEITGVNGSIAKRGMLLIEFLEAFEILFDFAPKGEPFRQHAAVLQDFEAQPLVAGEPFAFARGKRLAGARQAIEGTSRHRLGDLRLDQLFKAHAWILHAGADPGRVPGRQLLLMAACTAPPRLPRRSKAGDILRGAGFEGALRALSRRREEPSAA